MGILEEWTKSILKGNTRKRHVRSLRYFADYLDEAPITVEDVRAM